MDEALHAMAVLRLRPLSNVSKSGGGGEAFLPAVMEAARQRLMESASPYLRLRVVWSVAVLQVRPTPALPLPNFLCWCVHGLP